MAGRNNGVQAVSIAGVNVTVVGNNRRRGEIQFRLQLPAYAAIQEGESV